MLADIEFSDNFAQRPEVTRSRPSNKVYGAFPSWLLFGDARECLVVESEMCRLELLRQIRRRCVDQAVSQIVRRRVQVPWR